VGKGIGIRLTPTLDFIPDALPDGAAYLEDLLVSAKAHDAEVAAASTGAAYAGEADPYKKPVIDEEEPDEEEPADEEEDAAKA
jgi:ribosome-binding factor A